MSGAIGVSRSTIAAPLATITSAAESALACLDDSADRGEGFTLQTATTEQRDALDAAKTILGLVETSEREFERLARLVTTAEPETAALHLELEAKKGGPAAPLLRAMAQRLSPARLAAGHGRSGV